MTQITKIYGIQQLVITVIKGKLIMIQGYIRKEEKDKANNLKVHLKYLKNQNQNPWIIIKQQKSTILKQKKVQKGMILEYGFSKAQTGYTNYCHDSLRIRKKFNREEISCNRIPRNPRYHDSILWTTLFC